MSHMSYKWIKTDRVVRRLADGACIPNDAGNADWNKFKAWLALGGDTVEAEDPPLPLPSKSQIIDAQFPQAGTARTLFEALFEMTNDIRELKGRQPIDRAQLKAWLESKLP